MALNFQSEDKLSNLKSQIEREIAAEREKIKEDRIQVNQQMRQVSNNNIVNLLFIINTYHQFQIKTIIILFVILFRP